MSDQPLSPFTRQRIARLAEDTLRRADVAGEFPTPMEAVQQAAGVKRVVDMADLPKELEAKKPSAMRRILGALWFSERTIFIDRSEPDYRQQFTDGHEATHALCPWHEQILMLDDENSLFKDATAGVELEANFGSGHLMFQGGRFHRRALKEQVSISTPLAMHRDYVASRHATLHYYVQEHPDAVALLIAGRYPYANGTLPIWKSVESVEFLRRFGRLRDRLPGASLGIIDGENAPLADITIAARTTIDPPAKPVGIPDGDGTKRPFVAEAFYNGKCHFVMVSEEKARRLGRRIRLAS